MVLATPSSRPQRTRARRARVTRRSPSAGRLALTSPRSSTSCAGEIQRLSSRAKPPHGGGYVASNPAQAGKQNGRGNMTKTLFVSVSVLALWCGAPTLARAADPPGGVLEELIVTAQKREESVQDVPIAVSAFSQQALQARGIDGGANLVLAIPNLTFNRGSLSNNFQIRGIGSQLFSVSGDDGVGIHQNNVPLTTNRLADAEFYDVERVEVLRGPQGTLFGRNATGGVVNIITSKPVDHFAASISAELGNYNSRKFQGFFNVPFGDKVALRGAGFSLKRDGYTTNTLDGRDIDSRKIWAGRLTLSFKPSDNFRAFLMWDGFDENDSRGARKQLCEKDPGPTSILGVPTGVARDALTQGCLPVSVYDPNVYGTTNSLNTFAGILGRKLGLQPLDSFLGKTVSHDLREVEVRGRPIYRPRTDLYELNMEWDATPGLTFTSLTSYNENENYNRGDTNGAYPSVPFPKSFLAPNGTLNDPQMGLSDRLTSEAGLFGHSDQWSQEFRLQSKFSGPINFNIGGIVLDYNRTNFTYIAVNAATAEVKFLVPSAYVDPLQDPDFTGHNYFVSRTLYELKSKAVFGEVYWQATKTIRATVGLRYTDDQKWTKGSGSTLFTPGRGPTFTAPQTVEFKEATGRLNVDWTPELPFTDRTLVYASYSKGYKGGGFNPAGVAALGLKLTYEPEFVNAIEIGTKNTLLDGRLLLNLAAFSYDYKGYQIARNVSMSIFNDNVDAKIKGFELESTWAPVAGLQLNAVLGYVDTRIEKGGDIDPAYRTQGDPTYVYGSGGCIVNATGLAAVLSAPGGPQAMLNNTCAGPAAVTKALVTAGNTPAAAAALAAATYSYGPNVSVLSSGVGDGVRQSFVGNQLPNTPHWTVSLGSQYRWELPGEWSATLRGDYYRQAGTFARNNNEFFDKLRAWDNFNASLTFVNTKDDLTVQLSAKNILNKDTIVGLEIAADTGGDVRTPILLDPRLYSVSVTKRF
ncbi:MAG: TonB-dependent receptor [Caulobacterales bacterium]|nr:TonB-dependent receptor [Caulobacterales bacterium]